MTLDINFHFSKKNNKNLRIDIQFLVFLSFRDIRRSEKFSLNCRPKMENSQLHDNSRGTFETLHRAPNNKHFTKKSDSTRSTRFLVWKLLRQTKWVGVGERLDICFVVLRILLRSLLQLDFFQHFWFFYRWRLSVVAYVAPLSFFFCAQRQNQTVMSITPCRLLFAVVGTTDETKGKRGIMTHRMENSFASAMVIRNRRRPWSWKCIIDVCRRPWPSKQKLHLAKIFQFQATNVARRGICWIFQRKCGAVEVEVALTSKIAGRSHSVSYLCFGKCISCLKFGGVFRIHCHHKVDFSFYFVRQKDSVICGEHEPRRRLFHCNATHDRIISMLRGKKWIFQMRLLLVGHSMEIRQKLHVARRTFFTVFMRRTCFFGVSNKMHIFVQKSPDISGAVKIYCPSWVCIPLVSTGRRNIYGNIFIVRGIINTKQRKPKRNKGVARDDAWPLSMKKKT